MTTTIDYALLAGASYYDTRPGINRFPLPLNWSAISRVPQDGTTAQLKGSASHYFWSHHATSPTH
jgi:hypothetical protein